MRASYLKEIDMKLDRIGTIATFNLLILAAVLPACRADGFEHPCSWDAFNPGLHGIGDHPKGMIGGAFDGRYIYFAPYGQPDYTGDVLRLDTLGDFTDVAAWSSFNPDLNGVGVHPVGYWSAVFDGRYVIFIPMQNDTGHHGEVLRYDTTGEFENVASWEAFDPGANGVGVDPDGFINGVFDGRYVYFCPYNNGTRKHGEVMRYDTTGAFSDVASWITFDCYEYGVGVQYGYAGATFDGRYVYFAPYGINNLSNHGEVRRYDTHGEFTDASSWEAYNAAEHGLGVDPEGYVGAVFDGHYVYFVPYLNYPYYHGEVLRYDPTGNFDELSSWAVYDPGAAGLGNYLDGFIGGIFDGHYIYFIPAANNTEGIHSHFLCYDTTAPFDELTSWRTFDPRDFGISNQLGGYMEAVFDGRHIYFTPNRWLASTYGQILRYDTHTCPGDVNHDSVVDLSDLATLLGNYGLTADATCEDGDIDCDWDIDLDDLAALLGAYGDLCN